MHTSRWVQTNLVSSRTLQPSIEPVVTNFSVLSDFLFGRPSYWAGDCAPLLTLNFFSMWCDMINPTLLLTTFCAHRFFFHSFTASDGSEGPTAGCVVSPRSFVEHHRFRSKEVRLARKQHHNSHCWLPTKMMHPANVFIFK